MAQRDFESLRQNTQVPEADLSQETAINGIASAGQNIIEGQQKAKIAENLSKATLDLTEANQDYRQKNADDPFKNMDELKQTQQDIINSYGDQISPFFKRDWQNASREVSTRQDVQNEMWAYRQAKLNTVKSLNNSMQTSFQQANIDGQNYATGASTEADAFLNFGPGKQQLSDFGDTHIGSDKTTEILKGYDKDYMKSFVAGVAETSPQKAASLLDDPRIKGQFTTQERGEFVDIINKTQKQQDLQQSLQITQNTQQVTDLVNDQSQSYFNKRLQLDKLEMSKAITPTTAANARRVLTTQKDVDAVTHSDTMGGLVQKMYDLNSQSNLNNSDYLQGVQNLHNQILDQQAQGSLNEDDVKKMNDEMRTLTNKRVSDATKSIGNDMSDATDKFQQLPPEYRGEATRQLFYQTMGKQDSLTDDQFKDLSVNAANKIVDQINNQRRSDTMKTINSIKTISPDDLVFMKNNNYTLDDVQETAKKYKLTPAQVLQKLKDNKKQ